MHEEDSTNPDSIPGQGILRPKTPPIRRELFKNSITLTG